MFRKRKSADVIIPDGYKINNTEREAAWILAKHYKSIVRVLRPSERYMEKTADFVIDNVEYELKTPATPKAENINKLIKEGLKQSENIIIDSRKIKIPEKRMIAICVDRLNHLKKLKKIVLIVNKKKVLDFTK